VSNDRVLFPTAAPHNAQMNHRILEEVHRGEVENGGVDRLAGTSTESADLAPDAREELETLVAPLVDARDRARESASDR
jgi:hypothetical protein